MYSRYQVPRYLVSDFSVLFGGLGTREHPHLIGRTERTNGKERERVFKDLLCTLYSVHTTVDGSREGPDSRVTPGGMVTKLYRRLLRTSRC